MEIVLLLLFTAAGLEQLAQRISGKNPCPAKPSPKSQSNTSRK
mgnify:CR=1 FL=1